METTSSSNLDRYKKDVDLLIARGLLLHDAMLLYATHKEFQEDLDKMSPAEAKKTKDQVAKLPNFKKEY